MFFFSRKDLHSHSHSWCVKLVTLEIFLQNIQSEERYYEGYMFLVWHLVHFITQVALVRVSVCTNTNLACDYLTSRDAGVENDKSLQLDTRNNKMPDNEPGVPNNADNGKVNECLSPLNMNALIPTCLLKSSRDFVQHVWIHDCVQLCDNPNGQHVPCF